jgi:hypothetical protein
MIKGMHAKSQFSYMLTSFTVDIGIYGAPMSTRSGLWSLPFVGTDSTVASAWGSVGLAGTATERLTSL